MSVDTKEFTEVMNGLSETVAKIQEQNTKAEARGQKTTEGLEVLQNNFAEQVKTFEEMKGQIEAEQKAREALELTLARIKKGDAEPGKLGSSLYSKGFSQFIKSKGTERIDADAVAEEMDAFCKMFPDPEAVKSEVKGMYVGSNPDGGYTVPTDMRSEIIRRVQEITPMRQVANAVNTGTDRVSWIVDNDLTVRGLWVDELDEKTETDTWKIGEEEIPVHELYSFPFVTDKLLEDSQFNIEAFIMDKIARDFAKAESIAFTTGNGKKKPRGFMDYPTVAAEVYKQGSIGELETAASGVFAADDLINLQTTLLEPYQPNAKWQMTRQLLATITKFKDSQGQYLLDPRILFNGLGMVLLGKEVLINPELPTTVAAEGRILAYGDWRSYTIVDRLSMAMVRDPYTKATGVKFKVRRRLGGGVTNFQGIKTLKVKA